jgi:hypothetical protein
MTSSTKSMTRLFIILAGLLIVVSGCSDNEVTAPVNDDTFVIADDPLDNVLKSTDGQTPADPQDRCDRLAEVLGLDEDQLAALSAAYTVFREDMADLRTQVRSGEISLEEARAAAAVLRDAFEAELQLILTEEQWDMLQDMRDGGRRDEDHRDGHHGGGDGEHQDRDELWTGWFEELGLDADQIAAVLEALDTMHVGMQDIRAQVLDGTMTWEEARTAAQALRDDFDAALQSILTEEQYQALLDLRPDCEGPRHR